MIQNDTNIDELVDDYMRELQVKLIHQSYQEFKRALLKEVD